MDSQTRKYLEYVQEHKSLSKAFNQYWEDKNLKIISEFDKIMNK